MMSTDFRMTALLFGFALARLLQEVANRLPAPKVAFRSMLRMDLQRSEAFDDARWNLSPIQKAT